MLLTTDTMVLICDKAFTEEQYNSAFEKIASFELSDFQKWAIKGIINGDNVLITAHTGSGKTLPAEFMIEHFTRNADEEGRPRKKVIYASPIKALSNQKLHDMRAKYPDISIGLLTGDFKDNPEADVLIMTTEILRNTLFNKQIANSTGNTMPLSFDMDIDNELGGVVFDEVHYINDADRGSVWEQSILLLPPHIQLLMLSATIDGPEKFAEWIEKEKAKQAIKNNIPVKNMILAPTYERVVPLTHYMWLSAHPSIFKKVKNTKYSKPFHDFTNKLVPIKTPDGNFHDDNYKGLSKVKEYYWDNRVFVRRPYVLNGIVNYLKENEMLPAICFIFSRKHVELAAKEIQHSLFGERETQPNTVEKRCKQIIMSKFPNYKEYIGLPEFTEITTMLQKGIAIHHAGMLPVLREMIELLFDEGYIKLLFATETFSVGINMPTKTVIFSTLEKWDGSGRRNLLPHEYTQMAGRAGRRGLDTIGHVIHCNNLFDSGYAHEYKQILCGLPQKLVSKFKINYGLLLSVIASGAKNLDKIEEFVKQSLISREIAKEDSSIKYQIQQKLDEYNSLENSVKHFRTPIETVYKYIELINSNSKLNKKKRQKLEREINMIKSSNKFIESDTSVIEKMSKINKELEHLRIIEENTNSYIASEVNVVASILLETDFIKLENDEYSLTEKGKCASQMQEVHCLAFADMITSNKCNYFDNCEPEDIACILSTFANVRVPDDNKIVQPDTTLSNVSNSVTHMVERIEYYANKELREKINTGENCDYNYDLILPIRDWFHAEDEYQCKTIIQNLANEKEIFLGDFIKAVLKINNICAEVEKIAEIMGNIPLLEKLRKIPEATLKYVATNQSLYI